jgi:hypothetical protein
VKLARAAIGSGLVLAGAALATACGDVYADVSTKSEPNPVTTDASALIPRDLPASCPAGRPAENSFCNDVGATCEYGSSPDMDCNGTLACGGDPNSGLLAWTSRPGRLCSLKACPTGSIASIAGSACDLPRVDGGPPSEADEQMCAMTDGVCACTTGSDAAHAHPRTWICVKPVSPCPTTRPLAGQQCFTPQSCDYGSCAFKRGLKMECKDGVWITGGSSACN